MAHINCLATFNLPVCLFGIIFWATTWQNQQNECAPSEDSDQPRHPPSLIRVFAVRMKNAWVLSYPLRTQRRLWSDWADAQADLSLCWAHSHFLGFVMRRLFSSTHQALLKSADVYKYCIDPKFWTDRSGKTGSKLIFIPSASLNTLLCG